LLLFRNPKCRSNNSFVVSLNSSKKNQTEINLTHHSPKKKVTKRLKRRKVFHLVLRFLPSLPLPLSLSLFDITHSSVFLY
jgi:hypothetical protein